MNKTIITIIFLVIFNFSAKAQSYVVTQANNAISTAKNNPTYENYLDLISKCTKAIEESPNYDFYYEIITTYYTLAKARDYNELYFYEQAISFNNKYIQISYNNIRKDAHTRFGKILTEEYNERKQEKAKREKREKDDNEWQYANKFKTKAKYKDYLSAFPNGDHAEQARAAVNLWEDYEIKFSNPENVSIDEAKEKLIIWYSQNGDKEYAILNYDLALKYYKQSDNYRSSSEMKNKIYLTEEHILYGKIKRNGQVSDCETYVRNYPYGKYMEDAKTILCPAYFQKAISLYKTDRNTANQYFKEVSKFGCSQKNEADNYIAKINKKNGREDYRKSIDFYHYWGLSTGYVAKQINLGLSELWDSSKYINGITVGIHYSPTIYRNISHFEIGLDIGAYINNFFTKQTNINNQVTKYNEWSLNFPLHLEPKISWGNHKHNFFISAGTSLNVGLDSRISISDSARTLWSNSEFYKSSELGNSKRLTFPLEFGAGFTFDWFQIRGNYGFYTNEVAGKKHKNSLFGATIAFQPRGNTIFEVYNAISLSTGLGAKVGTANIYSEFWDNATSEVDIIYLHFGLRDNLTFIYDFSDHFGLGLDFGVFGTYNSDCYSKENIYNSYAKYWTLSIPLHLEPKLMPRGDIEDRGSMFLSFGTSLNIGLSANFSVYTPGNNSVLIYEKKSFYNDPEFSDLKRVTLPLEIGAGFTAKWFQLRADLGMFKCKQANGEYKFSTDSAFFLISMAIRLHYFSL